MIIKNNSLNADWIIECIPQNGKIVYFSQVSDIASENKVIKCKKGLV